MRLESTLHIAPYLDNDTALNRTIPKVMFAKHFKPTMLEPLSVNSISLRLNYTQLFTFIDIQAP
jgi:hypothetical protein